MAALLTPDLALEAYDGLAAHYDAFTGGHDYERWLDALERLAREHGLRGHRLLDVGCGTGKSFIPMLERGFEVTACDLSPEMVARASAKVADERVSVFVADMRTLPAVGAFDLVTCLDDAVNYLTSPEELRSALEGFARNLAPGGGVIFDVNSLATYRSSFAHTTALDTDGAFFCVRGEASAEIRPGGLAGVWIEVFAHDHDDLWRRTRTHHLQRHHPRADVEWAAAEAGLEIVAARGQSPGARIERDPDEERHSKIVYVARKPA